MTAEPLDLDAIRARLEAATPGPWEPESEQDGDHETGYADAIFIANAADATLISNAPTDIAALVAEVERLRADSVPRSALVQVGMHGQHPAFHFAHDRTDECDRYGCQPVYVLREQP